ncbi:MAG: TlpA family protein disulfide reductase [Cyclobacteriaceae bacterium]|nr:MAG: TlpA family protein disulfide reductase [Cyclobacteriaceae bacterium]
MIRLVLFLLLALAGCGPAPKKSQQLRLSDIRLSDLNGKPVDVSQYEGKTVLVNFWATWCKPCLQEMPSLASAQRQLKDEPIVFCLHPAKRWSKLPDLRTNKSLNLITCILVTWRN